MEEVRGERYEGGRGITDLGRGKGKEKREREKINERRIVIRKGRSMVSMGKGKEGGKSGKRVRHGVTGLMCNGIYILYVTEVKGEE